MFIIAYDFSNDKTRSRFSKFLEKYGRRIQYSVFEIKNSQRILDIVLAEIENIYEKQFTNNDNIIIFPLDKTCQKKIKRFGFAKHEESDIIFMGDG